MYTEKNVFEIYLNTYFDPYIGIVKKKKKHIVMVVQY